VLRAHRPSTEGKLGAGTHAGRPASRSRSRPSKVKNPSRRSRPARRSPRPRDEAGDAGRRFQQHFGGATAFKGILEARKFAKERGFTDDPKAIEEAIELAIVKTARGEVENSNTPQKKFERAG
jgi:hypothetical protein